MRNYLAITGKWLPAHRPRPTPATAQAAPVPLWPAIGVVIGGARIPVDAWVTVNAGGQPGCKGKDNKQGGKRAHGSLLRFAPTQGAHVHRTGAGKPT